MVASQSSTARDVGSTSASGSATTWAAAYAIRLLGGPDGSSRTGCLPGAYGSREPSACGSRICSVILSLLSSRQRPIQVGDYPYLGCAGSVLWLPLTDFGYRATYPPSTCSTCPVM